MTLAPNRYPALGSVIPPLSPLSEAAAVLEREDRRIFELEADTDDVGFYDLYHSPCRGVIKASNDELLDQEDVDTLSDDEGQDFAITYTNGGGPNKESDLYKAFHYYFDDLEYCGATFYGGCLYHDPENLQDEIERSESSPTIVPVSFTNFTVVFDYEIHYVQRPGETISNDQDDTFSERRFPAVKPFSRNPVDPIPALEQLETIVVEHLGEVVGLSRRGCDPTGRVSIGRTPRRSRMKNDFSDEELNRMMAISSGPRDVLDPDYAECIVPVSSSIGSISECMPVTGGIRIYLNSTGLDDSSLEALELSLQSGFQRLIRFGMQQDLYITDGDEDDDDDEVIVKYVSFIGTRIVVENDEFDGSVNGIQESSAVKTGFMVAFIGLVVTLFVL